MANGETEYPSLFVTQSFLLCSAAYSGIIAALFVPHTGLLHPPSLCPTPLQALTHIRHYVTGSHTGESDLGDEREFGVKSLAVCSYHLLVVATPFGRGWVIPVKKKRQSNYLNNILYWKVWPPLNCILYLFISCFWFRINNIYFLTF